MIPTLSETNDDDESIILLLSFILFSSLSTEAGRIIACPARVPFVSSIEAEGDGVVSIMGIIGELDGDDVNAVAGLGMFVVIVMIILVGMEEGGSKVVVFSEGGIVTNDDDGIAVDSGEIVVGFIVHTISVAVTLGA